MPYLLIFYNLISINLACVWHSKMTTHSMCGRRWQTLLCPNSLFILYFSLIDRTPVLFFFFFRVAMCPGTSIPLPRCPHSWADHVTRFWPMNVTRRLLGRASRTAVLFSVKGKRLCVPGHLPFPFLSHSCLDPICNSLGWISHLETTRMSCRMAQKGHRSLIPDGTTGPLL